MLGKPSGSRFPQPRAAAFRIALLLSAAIVGASASAQDRGVPFKVATVADQVVNGVLIQGGTVPVWTDPSGRPAGRTTLAAADTGTQAELDELARIGRQANSDAMPNRYRTPAPAPHAASPVSAEPVTAPSAATISSRAMPATLTRPGRGPQFDVVDNDDLPAPPKASTATLRKKGGRTDEDELATIEKKMAALNDEYTRKQQDLEARKRDVERRAEDARAQAEREKARKLLAFEAKQGQLLSEAIQAYAGKNGWENVEWNVGSDFRIKYAYTELPRVNEAMKDVLLRVLKPYKLSAELYRPNSVIEIFATPDGVNR